MQAGSVKLAGRHRILSLFQGLHSTIDHLYVDGFYPGPKLSHSVSIYDEDHSEDEDRWVSMGQAQNGTLLVVVHTWQETGETEAVIRIISTRLATTHEQRDYEQNP